jgi:UDP-glucose 4-epimerase
MTTLVTGAGAIGCHTARLLAERGESVLLLDIAPRGDAMTDSLGAAPVEIVTGDVTDHAALLRLVRERHVRRIVHTAALLSAAIRRDPRRGYLANIAGAANVLDIARSEALERVVLASSTTVGYGAFDGFAGTAFPEDFALRIASQAPTSFYAASKVAGEHLALAYRAQYNVDFVALRYAAVVNVARGGETSIPGRLFAALLEAGRARRRLVLDDPFLLWSGREEFVDARDCARANLAALDARAPVQRIYNIATGAWHTLPEFVAAIRAVFPELTVEIAALPKGGFAGFPFERPAPSDPGAAARELDFRAAYSLAESARHYAALAGSVT